MEIMRHPGILVTGKFVFLKKFALREMELPTTAILKLKSTGTFYKREEVSRG